MLVLPTIRCCKFAIPQNNIKFYEWELMEMSGVKYIYNLKQANFFMEENVKCMGVGKHPETGKMYFKFGYDECQPAYEKWIKRNR